MAPHDQTLPVSAVLLGDGARDVVAAAVEATGGRVHGVARRQVLYRPGRATTVRYDADVEWDGQGRRTETIVAVADRDGPPEGTLVVEADGLVVGLFRYPHDPALPGLATAVHPSTAAALLGSPGGRPTLTVTTYRPCQRAVVRATSADGSVHYLKVMPVDDARRLTDTIAVLTGRLPVPRVVSGDEQLGVVALEGLAGTPMRDVLRSGGDVPSPHDVVALLDGLAARPPDGLARAPSLLRAARSHAALLAAVMPSSRHRIERFAERLAAGTSGDGVAGRTGVVHGDFHPAQVLVDGGSVTGLIDLDDVGTGDRADDLATFLGHVATLALDRDATAARQYLARALPVFESQCEPAALHRRTAAVVLGLATGPHRVQEPSWRARALTRLSLAERWLSGDVRSLRTAS